MLHDLLHADLPAPIDTLDAWRQAGPRPAWQGGLAAARPAFAFLSGYQAALHTLVPSLAGKRVALCVTEAGGNHPRQIQTTWDGRVLNGTKRFVTLGVWAQALVVVARRPVEGPRPQLVAVRVDTAGLVLEPGPPVPVVPEAPHASVTLRDTPGVELPGDGWSDYAKPFRTREDSHVQLALCCHWIGLIRRNAPSEHDLLEQLATLALAQHAITQQDPGSPATHAALAGAEARLVELLETPPEMPSPVAQRWGRDRHLLRIARGARARRRERAWALLDPV